MYNLCLLSKEIMEIEKFNQALLTNNEKILFSNNLNSIKKYFVELRSLSSKFLLNLRHKITNLSFFVSIKKNTLYQSRLQSYLNKMIETKFNLSVEDVDYLKKIFPEISKEEM